MKHVYIVLGAYMESLNQGQSCIALLELMQDSIRSFMVKTTGATLFFPCWIVRIHVLENSTTSLHESAYRKLLCNTSDCWSIETTIAFSDKLHGSNLGLFFYASHVQTDTELRALLSFLRSDFLVSNRINMGKFILDDCKTNIRNDLLLL